MSQHFTTQTLNPVSSDIADAEQKKMLYAEHAAPGFIPDMYVNMVNVPGVLSTYLHGFANVQDLRLLNRKLFFWLSVNITVATTVLPHIACWQIKSLTYLALYVFTQVLVSTGGKPSKKQVIPSSPLDIATSLRCRLY